ncbi:MAG: hypothetical protein V4502_09555 [Pseudomonadota bacterium]
MKRLTILLRSVNPWARRSDRQARQVQSLRNRDGDDCRRCRRPLRFDLPHGHDLGPKIEPVPGEAASGEIGLLCLTHGRCNRAMADHTGEVLERVRRRNEAELLAKPKRRRTRSAAA